MAALNNMLLKEFFYARFTALHNSNYNINIVKYADFYICLQSAPKDHFEHTHDLEMTKIQASSFLNHWHSYN
jgi:hypothetical protein